MEKKEILEIYVEPETYNNIINQIEYEQKKGLHRSFKLKNVEYLDTGYYLTFEAIYNRIDNTDIFFFGYIAGARSKFIYIKKLN